MRKLWSEIPVYKKLYTVLGLMAILIASELFTLIFAMNTLSSVRALVSGEGIWSKSQKDAVHSLYQYALTSDERHYVEFSQFLDVTLGDQLARNELEKKSFDLDVVRNGFLKGGNHRDDIDGMIKLLVRFNEVSYIHEAVAAWTKADLQLDNLRETSLQIHQAIQGGTKNSSHLSTLLGRVAQINSELTSLENKFSSALGEGSRWLEVLLLKVLVVAVLTIESMGILLTLNISRKLNRSFKELINTVLEVGKGNFKASAPVHSKDDLGQLAIAFNSMIHQLDVSLREQKRTQEEKVKFESTFHLLTECIEDYAIYMLDPNGRVTTWNHGAQKIKGYTANEIIGKHYSVFFTLIDKNNRVPEENLETARKIGHLESEGLRVRKNGNEFWADVVITALRDSSGNLTGFAKITRDITERKIAEQKLRQLNNELEMRIESRTRELKTRETQLKSITNAAPVLIVQMDTDERILFANQAFCNWFRKPIEKVIGSTFKEVIDEERYAFHKAHIQRVLAGETTAYERLSEVGNEKAHYAITLVPVSDGGTGHILNFILVASDVSNYKKIEAELKVAKASADLASSTKSSFLANMSHEIRTPLTAILGFSEIILEESTTNEKREQCARVIRSNGRILSNLINDILDLSKVEAGKLEIEKLNVTINDVINELKSLLSPLAYEKSISLKIEISDSVPKIINTDPLRLRQILMNLAGNAIKFTERGSVEVNVELLENEADKRQLTFLVKDTGRGISPEQTQRLFSPFTQADASTTRKFGGTGLGLVLSKNLAKALGGDVILGESVLGKGSTFIFTIDPGNPKQDLRKELVHENNEKNSQAIPPEQSENARVLIVDDSLDNQALVAHFLQKTIGVIDTAINGREGVEKAMRGNYSVVLMDIQMPEMDGFAALKELRMRGFKRPIIALTAHAMKEDRKQCLSSGFDDYVTKPIDRKQLSEAISRHLI